MSARIVWIDMLRGFCMMAILWFHTEIYYIGVDKVPYELYVGDVLATFFFLSGYVLGLRKTFDAQKMIHGVARWLLLPYFVFTFLIAVPKALMHGSFEGFSPIVLNILSGHASWFVSALIVAQLFFIVIMKLFNRSTVSLVIAALLSLVAVYIIGNSESAYYYEADLWHVNEALLGFTVMVIGYLFSKNEVAVSGKLFSGVGIIALVIMFMFTKCCMCLYDIKAIFAPVTAPVFSLFFFDLIVSVFLLVGIFRLLPENKVLVWVGQRSIAYYFICGGCPFVVAELMNKIGFSYAAYWQVPIVYILVCLLSTTIVALIYRYTRILKRP